MTSGNQNGCHLSQFRQRITIAKNLKPRKLTSDGDLDRAMDFASSASPRWLDTADFPCWGHDGREFDPRFLKLQKSFVRHPTNKKKRIPAISYVMVNEESDRSFIVVGAVVCVGSTTYYIQHNSKRPISDAIVKRVLRRVVESVPAPQQ